jgi:hypothetical protein
MNKRQEAENYNALAVAATMVMDELAYDNHRTEVAAAITLLTEYRAQWLSAMKRARAEVDPT